MDIDKISVFAAKGEMPKENISLSEWLLFYRLRDLYRDFEKGNVGIESGKEKKDKIIKQFKSDNEQERRVSEHYKRLNETMKRIEISAMNYAQNKTIENADRFMEAVYGVPLLSEDERKKRQ